MVVDLTDKFYGLIEFFLLDVGCAAQDDRACILDLVLVELAEVLKIDPALGCIDDRNGSADLGAFDFFYCGYDIGELADARGFDEDPVGSICVDDFL